MKRNWILRFYPRAWRERYGAEMEALLEDAPPRASDVWDLLKGALLMHQWRTWAFIGAGAICCLTASFAVARARMVYQASAEVLFLRGSDPQVAGPAMSRVIAQTFKREALKELIQSKRMYPAEQNPNEAAERLRRDFRIANIPSTLGQTARFRFTFQHEDPAIARAAAEELTAAVLRATPDFQLSRATGDAAPDGPNGRTPSLSALAGALSGWLIARLTARRRA